MHPISIKLAKWYKQNKRDLPWRNTSNPYFIWLSEIIMQQTQVAQGLSYYLKFVETFPTVVDLANASEDLVLKNWQGLGYYSRARNLHASAKLIRDKYKGVFPNTYDAIKELKGVGDYTTAAIASIAYDLPYAVVDGNVYRVLSRLFDIHTPINSGQGKKEFQLIADELLDKKNPAQHNNAMMEFGALYCKPSNPKCDDCVLQGNCMSFQRQTTNLLPVKTKTVKIKNRYFNYIIFNYKNWMYLSKRTEKDIWQNLFEFYLIESNALLMPADLFKEKVLKDLKKEVVITSRVELKKHILSHQHIYAVFYEVELKTPIIHKSLLKIKKTELGNYALPQLINKYLEMKQ